MEKPGVYGHVVLLLLVQVLDHFLCDLRWHRVGCGEGPSIRNLKGDLHPVVWQINHLSVDFPLCLLRRQSCALPGGDLTPAMPGVGHLPCVERAALSSFQFVCWVGAR